MEKVYELIDKYVSLLYISRILTLHGGNNNCLDSSFSDIDFYKLGLNEELLKYIKENSSAKNLRMFLPIFLELCDEVSREVFGSIIKLSTDEKLQLKEHLESRIICNMPIIDKYQTTYLTIVSEIEKTNDSNKNNIRELGKLAKINFNKLYEYNFYNQHYSNLVSYVKGMLGATLIKK